jgi:hypothetical protein
MGATISDGLVFVATVGLFGAMLFPAWSARDFRARVSSAAADVEILAAAAREALDDAGAWPTAAAPGEPPPELAGLAAVDSIFAKTEYRLGWTSWLVVDSIEAPDLALPPVDAPDFLGPRFEPVVRSIGGVAVYSSEAPLLAELVARYTTEVSFVLDTMWLLVLPERGPVRPDGAVRPDLGAPTP